MIGEVYDGRQEKAYKADKMLTKDEEEMVGFMVGREN